MFQILMQTERKLDLYNPRFPVHIPLQYPHHQLGQPHSEPKMDKHF